MEKQNDHFSLLEMIPQPVFCAKDHTLVAVNSAAAQLCLSPGQDLSSLLLTGSEEYAAFTGGSLYLTLDLAGQRIDACVQKWEDADLFRLDLPDDSVLQAMALASRELRKPLTSALTSTAGLLESQEDLSARQQLAQLNQSLYRMLRILGNMSDAQNSLLHMQTTEAVSFFHQILEKARTLLSGSGISLAFQVPEETVYCLLDREQMERAVLNLLSNAAKFTPPGGTVIAVLSRRGRSLRLCVQDSGSGIPQDIMGSLFRRHLRQPGIEDSRYGLGLGIQMIYRAALDHGGTLLVCPGKEGGTALTMTVAIRQSKETTLRSPVFAIDYTGGFDHSLVELSDVLSAGLFDGSF